jgi:hypothetical protein
MPSPPRDSLRKALLTSVTPVLVLPTRYVRITGEEAGSQIAGIFEGAVKGKIYTEVIVEAAVAHAV